MSLRPRELDVLATLALGHPRPTPMTAIVETLWPRGAPRSARAAVHNHVSRLRRALGDGAVVTDGVGYRLGSDWTVDTERISALVKRARRAADGGDSAMARALLQNALALFRGAAFADLAETTAALAERARHHQLRLALEEEVTIALLVEGEVRAAVAAAAAHATSEPFRELRWRILALALYRDGQRRESVEALQRGRAALLDVGLEVGPALARLEKAILADDASLADRPPASLLGNAAGGASIERSAEVFVGRAEVLDDARRLLADTFEAPAARRIELVGEAGVGKTELVRRIAMQAADDGWIVAEATCNAVASRLLEPFGDLVRQLVGHLPNPADVIEHTLLDRLGVLWADAADGRGGDLTAIVGDAVAQHADRFPTLLIVDDAHVLPASSARVLDQLRTVHAPLVLLVVAREIDDSSDADTRIVLEGLDLTETTSLLQILLQTPVDADAAAAVHAATGGNPSHVRSSLLVERAGQVPADRAVGRLLHAAFDRMPRAVLHVAQLVAVAGGPVAISALSTAAEDDPADAVIAAGRAGGVLRTTADGRVDLVTLALREELLAGLDQETRVTLHERVGRALLAGGNAQAAAPHLLAAAERAPLLAIEVAEAAADVAERAAVNLEAAAFAASAAELAARHLGDAHRRTLTLVLRRAENLRRVGAPDYVDLVRDVIARADAAEDDVAYALGVGALCKLGPVTAAGTLDVELAAMIDRAVARCPDAGVRAYCGGEAVLFHSLSGEVERCRALFDSALADARASGDDRLVHGVLGNVVVALVDPADWRVGAELAAEMLMLAERLDDDDAMFQALHLYFTVQVQFADPLLRTTFERQSALAESLRSAGRRWMAGYQRACLAYLDGRLDESEAIARDIFDKSPVGYSRKLSTLVMALVVVRIAQGREQELREQVDAAQTEQANIPGWRAVAAWIAALRGDADRVRTECDALSCGDGLPHEMTWSGAAVFLGRAVAAIGDRDRSARVLDLVAPYSGLMTWMGSTTIGPFDVALAELALAMGDVAAAENYLVSARRCVTRLRALVYEPDLARIAARIAAAR